MPVHFHDDVEEARGDGDAGADVAEVRMALSPEADEQPGADLGIEMAKPSASGGKQRLQKKDKAEKVERPRRWLKIAPSGEDYIVGSSTLKLAHKLGVQPRDLRWVQM